MYTKTLFPTGRSVGFVFSLCFFLAVPFSAEAGFQWVPPEQAAPSAPPVSYPDIVPQIIEAPVPTAAMPETPSFGAPTFVPPPAGTDRVLQGFANQVPLAVALRQILPPDMAFSVAQDVSLGTIVSWKGGASWRQVLGDMLSVAGLSFREQGQTVQIVAAAPASPAAAPAAMQAEEKAFSAPPQTVAASSPQPQPQPQPEAAKPVALVADSAANAPPTMGYLVPPAGLAPVLSSADQVEAFQLWTAEKGATLRQILTDWCRKNRVDLSWQAEYDYPLQASVSLSGSFEDAVRSLLGGFQNAKPQPVGQLHKNEAANQTALIIQTRGNDTNE